MLAKEVRVNRKVKGPECINSIGSWQSSDLKYLICAASATEPEWVEKREEEADIIYKQQIGLKILKMHIKKKAMLLGF